MTQRKNRNLHIVKGQKNQTEQLDQTDQIVNEIIRELNSEDGRGQDMEEEIRKHKARKRRRIIIIIAVVLVAAVGVYLLVNLQTYSEARTIELYQSEGSANNNYRQFSDGVLKYNRDGIAFLNQKGEEQWNHSYQIKTPVVDVRKKAGAVADKGGNDILVFQREGILGELHTTMPIEKISVSEQGIVCAILKNDSSAEILCYDTAGNVLVEHKTSVTGTGYPLDVNLSEDGELMQVLYLYTQDGKITSRVVYYNFGQAGEEVQDHQVAAAEYENTIMASGFFLDRNTSVAVGDDCLAIYRGSETPEEEAQITLDKEVKSLFHNERYVGLILQNEGKEGYELRLYNASAQMVMSEEFTGDYENVKICGSQVILYDGKKCRIFMRSGIQKFDGEMDNSILEIFPTTGVNKYIVMSANGMEKIRLVK